MDNIKGIVIEGKKKGRTLGFPTANIVLPKNVAPEAGIYAGRVTLNNKTYNSAMYLAGNNILEAYIFDFSENIYGKEIEVKLIKKIRDKINFKDNREAAEQIAKDIKETEKCLQEL